MTINKISHELKRGAFTGWGTPSIRTTRRTVSWSSQASDGAGGWFHVMAMGEQITNIAKISIIGIGILTWLDAEI